MINPWRTFLPISVGMFSSALDLFIVNITFTDLQRDFPGATVAELSWVINGYAVVFAACLVAAGRLADLYGARRWFVIGMLLFTLASVACAVAPSVGFLIGARVAQGAGAAILTPSSLGVVLPAFGPEKRSSLYAAWAAIGAVGAAAGPPLGGLLVQASWRWVFLVNIPLGLVSIWYAWRRLGEVRDPDAPGLPDLAGAALLTTGIGALVLGLVNGRDWGWTSIGTLASFVVATILTGLAVVRSARHPVPALELALLRIRPFTLSIASAVTFSAAFGASLLAGVLFLTQVWEDSILRAGMELAAGPLAAIVFAVVAAMLGPRIGMPATGAIGCLLVSAGAAYFLGLGLEPNYPGAFLPGLVILGAGVGLSIPAFTAVAVGSAQATQVNTAIGISSMSREVGVALGIAGFVAVVGSPVRAEAVAAYRNGWIFMAAAALLAAGLMFATHLASLKHQQITPEVTDDGAVPAIDIRR